MRKKDKKKVDVNKLMAREGINSLDYLLNAIALSAILYLVVSFIVEKV